MSTVLMSIGFPCSSLCMESYPAWLSLPAPRPSPRLVSVMEEMDVGLALLSLQEQIDWGRPLPSVLPLTTSRHSESTLPTTPPQSCPPSPQAPPPSQALSPSPPVLRRAFYIPPHCHSPLPIIVHLPIPCSILPF